MSQLTEHDLQMLADYKTRQAQLQQKDAELQAEKARAEAYWNNKKASLPVGTPQTDQKCGDCGATIPAHTPAKYSTAQAVYGTNIGLKRIYHCNNCRPLIPCQEIGVGPQKKEVEIKCGFPPKTPTRHNQLASKCAPITEAPKA
jgi:hypothetical protein